VLSGARDFAQQAKQFAIGVQRLVLFALGARLPAKLSRADVVAMSLPPKE